MPIRVCGDRGGHHFEVRTIDGTANPYLVLAGILVAGLQGVLSSAELKSGDCKKPKAIMDEVERRSLGLESVRSLPRTIGDARTLLREDEYLNEKLGADFVEKYLETNEVSHEPVLYWPSAIDCNPQWLERDMTQDTQEATLACMIERY